MDINGDGKVDFPEMCMQFKRMVKFAKTISIHAMCIKFTLGFSVVFLVKHSTVVSTHTESLLKQILI